MSSGHGNWGRSHLPRHDRQWMHALWSGNILLVDKFAWCHLTLLSMMLIMLLSLFRPFGFFSHAVTWLVLLLEGEICLVLGQPWAARQEVGAGGMGGLLKFMLPGHRCSPTQAALTLPNLTTASCSQLAGGGVKLAMTMPMVSLALRRHETPGGFVWERRKSLGKL
jgi:hypothetical protein